MVVVEASRRVGMLLVVGWGGEGGLSSCGDGGGDERHDSTLTVSLRW